MRGRYDYGESVILSDDNWIGLGSGAARIIFDDQTTDQIEIMNANVGIGTQTPATTLDVNGNITVGNNNWIGLGASSRRIVFGDQINAYGPAAGDVLRFNDGMLTFGAVSPKIQFNGYYAPGDKYAADGSSFAFTHAMAQHKVGWFYAASGTAGETITYTLGMFLDSSGHVGVGVPLTHSLNYKLELADHMIVGGPDGFNASQEKARVIFGACGTSAYSNWVGSVHSGYTELYGWNGCSIGTATGATSYTPIIYAVAAGLGIGTATFGTNATKTLAVGTGVAPTTSPADSFQMYSADIATGHAAAHFRSENDTIIKLYQQSLIASPAADVDELKTAVDSIRTLLSNNGLMASS